MKLSRETKKMTASVARLSVYIKEIEILIEFNQSFKKNIIHI